MSWTRVALALWLIAAFTWPGTARAQDLRAQLERVRKEQPAIPEGAFTSVAYTLDVSERIGKRFSAEARQWRATAAAFLRQMARGENPYPKQAGRIRARGYVSAISTRRQGYAVYLPPGYDPQKRYPLMVVLHGGSSNGNLFLGVVLGNNMNWKTYDQHLWDEYKPRITPDWIVVSPDGFGQVMWRWMGEQDVLDVLDDVHRHYAVDPNRVVLSGLSNGGVGAYSLGARHGWRFSAVQAIAGAPGWRQYSGEQRVKTVEQRLMRPMSGFDLAENYAATDFRYYHGDSDPGPMRPAFVKAFSRHVKKLGVPVTETWYEAGHDLLYLVQRRDRSFERLAEVRRNPSPQKVTLVTGDYRAARQHWLTVTRIDDYPSQARAQASVDGDHLRIDSENVRALHVDLRHLPRAGDQLRLTVNGSQLYAGPAAELGHRVHAHREGDRWKLGAPVEGTLEKRPGLSGPLTDAYHGAVAHVYGTANPEHTDALQKTAKKGARGWPKWLWGVEQKVLADTEVTPAFAQQHHLVLYGTPGDNSVLERLGDRLPIRVDASGVHLGERTYDSKGVGVRFIYPNPEAPGRYLIVQASPTLDGLRRGHNLPDFVPDYLVYDAASARIRPRLVPPRNTPARGFFDDGWQLAN